MALFALFRRITPSIPMPPEAAVLLTTAACLFGGPSVKLISPENNFSTSETRITYTCEIDGNTQPPGHQALKMGENHVFCQVEEDGISYSSDTVKVTRNCREDPCIVKLRPDLPGDSPFYTKDSVVIIHWWVEENPQDSFMVELDTGINPIPKTYQDAEGASGSDSITVHYDPVPPQLDITEGAFKNEDDTLVSYGPVQAADNIGLRKLLALINRETYQGIRRDTLDLTGSDRTFSIQFPKNNMENVHVLLIAIDKAGNVTRNTTQTHGDLDLAGPVIDSVKPDNFELLNDSTFEVKGIKARDDKSTVEWVRLLDVTGEEKELAALTFDENLETWNGRIKIPEKSAMAIKFSAGDTSDNKGSSDAITLAFKDTIPPHLPEGNIKVQYESNRIDIEPFEISDTFQPFWLVPSEQQGMGSIELVYTSTHPQRESLGTGAFAADGEKNRWRLKDKIEIKPNCLTELWIIPQDRSGNKDTVVIELKSRADFKSDIFTKKKNQWQLIGLPYPVTYNELKKFWGNENGRTYIERIEGNEFTQFNPDNSDSLLEAGNAFLWGSLDSDLEFPSTRNAIPRPRPYISLNSGWNLISTPYPFQVAVKSQADNNPSIWRLQFDKPNYSWKKTETMTPFEGYAVYAEESGRLTFEGLEKLLKRAPSRPRSVLTERMSGQSVYFSSAYAATPLLRTPNQKTILSVLERGRKHLLASRLDSSVKTIVLTLENSALVNFTLEDSADFGAAALYDRSLEENLLEKQLSLPSGSHYFLLTAGSEAFIENIEIPEDFPSEFNITPKGTLPGNGPFSIAYNLPPGLSFPVDILLTFYSVKGRKLTEGRIRAASRQGLTVVNSPKLKPGIIFLTATLDNADGHLIRKITLLK